MFAFRSGIAVAYLILSSVFLPAVQGAPIGNRRRGGTKTSARHAHAVDKRVEGDSTRAPEVFIVIVAEGTNLRSHFTWVSTVLVANGAAPIPGFPPMNQPGAPGEGNPPNGGAPSPAPPSDGNPPTGGAPGGSPPSDGTPTPPGDGAPGGSPPSDGTPTPPGDGTPGGNPPSDGTPVPQPGDGTPGGNPPSDGSPPPPGDGAPGGNPPSDGTPAPGAPGGSPPSDGTPTPPGDGTPGGSPPSDGTPTPPGNGAPGGTPPNDGTPIPQPGDGAPGAPGAPAPGGSPATGPQPVDDLPDADEADPDYGGGGKVPCPGNNTPFTLTDGPVDASAAYISGVVGVGYWGYFPNGLIEVFKANPDVIEVHQDFTAEIAVLKERTVTPQSAATPQNVSQSAAPWHLSRISSRKPDPSMKYHYNSLGGSNVTIHVIDSGILTSHSEFGGRASMAWAAKPYKLTDEQGHGTFVAALAAGATYGAAKSASIIGYRVVDKVGSGYTSDIMAAINKVTLYARKNKGSHVINISLTLPRHGGLDRAVRRASRLGIHIVAAAGNRGTDVQAVSPAGAAQAISVGATASNDHRSSFSNTGVDLYAPGEAVHSAALGSSTRGTTLSGTSMAAPLVAGVIALELSIRGPQRPEYMSEWVVNSATDGVVKGTPTPSKLLFNCWNELNLASNQTCWDFVDRTPIKAIGTDWLSGL